MDPSTGRSQNLNQGRIGFLFNDQTLKNQALKELPQPQVFFALGLLN
jgi:hypothetical protein